MAYADARVCYDADSHIMELPDFLSAFADPHLRDRLPPISTSNGGRNALGQDDVTNAKAHAPEHVSALLALGDGLIAGPKGYHALGAFNAGERRQALDMLGFAKQLVFATFSPSAVFDEGLALDLRYGAARAHNRAMADFCGGDGRLMGVAMVPLDEPSLALAELEHARDLGLKAVWVPHRPCGGRSPGHNDLDPVWAAMAEAGLPFVLHVGGTGLQIPAPWMNTGRPVPEDWLGGGENVRGKDMIALHHGAETFIGTMVLDGVLERHPHLRGAVVELGAGYVPALLRRLDWTAQIWRKSEADLKALSAPPSQQIIGRIGFTPYPYEDVGALIRESDARLYLFSSDYPHIEGGRAPLQRFEQLLGDAGSDARDRFYARNFADLFAL
ncbi:amidohydrolase family protein [Zavarzinia sp. CC-PAN008]|uniref:amidohydrolase family protein n=1 Tax=Zavarzinia sp. CC-PAN008 TaxID=3243332 RepID=UPI003F7446C4